MLKTPKAIASILVAGVLLWSNPTIAHAQTAGLPMSDNVSVYRPVESSTGQTPNFHQIRSPLQTPSSPALVGDALIDPVDRLYKENAERPLGGLFAKGFTRTMTLLGGWNFANSIDANQSAIDPLLGFSLPTADSIDLDDGYAISFAFGRRHSHRLRSEIELAVRENDLSINSPTGALENLFQSAIVDGTVANRQEDSVRAYSVMKNFIFERDNASRFTPYVGAGLGWSYLDVEAPSAGIDEGIGAFSYQGIGGVATRLNKATDFIVEYRFLSTSNVDLETADQSVVYRTHNLFMGLKLEY